MSALVWDFCRAVGAADGTGAAVHYYDEMSQSIYLKNGMATRIAEVPEGHWSEAEPGAEITITPAAYSALAFDHPANGTLYGVAVEGSRLWLLRYVYAMDCTDLVAAFEHREQADNAIATLSGALYNVDYDIFTSEYTLFNPGAKVTLALTAGNSEPFPVFTGYLDEVSADRHESTVPFSARNTVGWFLRDQTFDEDAELTGTADEIMTEILARAGITNYAVQPGDHVETHLFKADQTLLQGAEQLFAYYTPWTMAEMPDGKIVAGYPTSSLFRGYRENGVYAFTPETGFMRREVAKRGDSAYTHLRVTSEQSGKDEFGEPNAPLAVYLPIENFRGWALGVRKTCHMKAPRDMDMERLSAYAADLAARMRYVGATESFEGPLKPYILVGDVGDLRLTGQSDIRLGIITGVTNGFDKRRGYYTDFTLDSGGEFSGGVSRVTALGGYNRRQSLIDFISNIAAKGSLT